MISFIFLRFRIYSIENLDACIRRGPNRQFFTSAALVTSDIGKISILKESTLNDGSAAGVHEEVVKGGLEIGHVAGFGCRSHLRSSITLCVYSP